MLRLGIVDFDSSHSIEFTRRFNQVGLNPDQYVDGARVVAGWPGTSEMAPERIPGFLEQMIDAGVEIVDSPDALHDKIDAALVLSLCGAAHLERARPFLEAKIPTFVDKPFACSVEDARQIVELADSSGAQLLYSSALRYSEEVLALQRLIDSCGPLHGLVSYGPAKRAEGNPGLLHYGVHALELMCTLMGPGCRRVSASHTDGVDVVTGTWDDGRVATLRGLRSGSTAYGLVAFCEQAVLPRPVSTIYAYRNLCRAIVRALESGEELVTRQEMVEIVAVALAALESERRWGVPVDVRPSEE